MDNEKYPFYPNLSEAGKQEAARIVEDFKKRLAEVAKEAIGQLYVDVADFIESDSWTNYRNKIMDGFRDYHNKPHVEYDFKAIREKLFRDFHDEIIADLNQDLVKENESLKKQLEWEREYNERSRA